MKVETAQEREEKRLRTLYIRLPHTIKNIDEIRDLVFGDANIKLPRQSGRHCHVIFPTVEEKLKNMKALKKKLIDNKHIFVSNPKIKSPEAIREKKKKLRKIKPREIGKVNKEEEKITKICFIHKIPKSATVKDLKELFPNAKSVAILFKQRLKDNVTGRTGIVKFRDIKTAGAYLRKECPWPVCKGVQLEIRCDKRRQKNRKKKKTESLKIYDEDEKVESETEKVKSESEDDDDDDDDDEEEVEEEEEEGDQNAEETSDEEE